MRGGAPVGASWAEVRSTGGPGRVDPTPPGTPWTENGSLLGSKRLSFWDEVGKIDGPEYIPKLVFKKNKNDGQILQKLCQNGGRNHGFVVLVLGSQNHTKLLYL